MNQITTGDGCRIAFRLDGPAGAPCLMLSNSLGTTMDMWASQIGVLSQTHRVLRYDSRGHGLSAVPAGAYSIDRLGCDVIELLDQLGIEKISFCGLSLGGMIGQWLAWRTPERISRLILANTSSCMGPPKAWDDRIAIVVNRGMTALLDPVLERWFTPGFRAAREDAVAPVRAMLLSTPPGGYAGCCGAIRDMDQSRLGALIDRPTLVIGGSSDPATPPDHAARLASRIAGAQLEMLDAAHLSNIEQSTSFTEAVTRFLNV